MPVTTSSARALAAFRAGRGHQASGRIDEARAAYHDALAEDPGFAQAHVFLGAVGTDPDVHAAMGASEPEARALLETLARRHHR